jgi:hypothetical protein
MPRGKPAKDGDEYTAANGYRYRKVDGKWMAVHHIIAQEKAGRAIDFSRERVYFIDNNRTNLDPSNIAIGRKKRGKLQRINTLRNALLQRMEELQDIDPIEAWKIWQELEPPEPTRKQIAIHDQAERREERELVS